MSESGRIEIWKEDDQIYVHQIDGEGRATELKTWSAADPLVGERVGRLMMKWVPELALTGDFVKLWEQD